MPFPETSTASDTAQRTSVAAWGVFLGSSWTWCIGMFLPVLLVREMGLWGWVVFAVPNVIGAAAMGWVLRSTAQSQRLVERHRSACVAFSLVTIAFHVFFLGWFLGERLLNPWWAGAGCALGGVMWAVGRGRSRRDLLAAAAVYVVSVAALATVAAARGLMMPAVGGAIEGKNAAYLAPVCIFGFMLCPYLDLTFHRARQEAGSAGRGAFTVGFGIFFLAMIVFSLLYATPVARIIEPGVTRTLPTMVAVSLGIHMVVQSGFTISVHLRELAPSRRGSGGHILLAAATVIVPVALALIAAERRHWMGMDIGEVIYRLFMSFYGLAFPAYVWICMVSRDEAGGMGRRRWAVLAGAIVLSAPLFWMGFIQGRMVWLVPGVGVVVASRLLAGRSLANARD